MTASETTTTPILVTPEVAAFVGRDTGWVPLTITVEPSEVRRFAQATMDDAARYVDPEAASRFGGLVAPPGFPMHMSRPAVGGPDPLADIDRPDADGVSRNLRGLPALPLDLPRVLNGGYAYEFFSYARHGEQVERLSAYRDIYEKTGRSGPMVFVVIEERFRTTDGRPLLHATSTLILR